MMSDNRRQTYLRETLGLSHDPFGGPVAEQELHSSSEKEPYFFSYFINPQDPKTNKPVLQALKEAQNGFVFGQPGSGKTTLRYTLEAERRAVYDRTLIVSYELSHKITRPPTAEEHWDNIANELAIDLFIQIIEQFDALDVPTDIQKQHLQTQMSLVWPRLRRTVQLMLKNDYSEEENGLASLWRRWNRPAVRYIAPSQKIKALVEECLPGSNNLPNAGALSGSARLKKGLAAAKAWGFEKLFVLVDGVDAYERTVDNMLALIAPLLDALPRWQAEKLFFYFFLNPEMRLPLINQHKNVLNALTTPPIYLTIEWDERTLSELLHQRLSAAGSWAPGLNALAKSPLNDTLETKLIETAQQSPRRLLQEVSALIDAHAQNRPDQPLFTLEDWQDMRGRWRDASSVSPDLSQTDPAP